VRLTYDDLAGQGFQNEADFESLDVDLCRLEKPAARQWPLVAPSPELYGSVMGWRVEPTPGSATEGVEPDTMMRDRNVYEPYRWMFSPLHERAEELEDRMEEVAAALLASAPAASAMTIGRIVPEVDASRIIKASVVLELQPGSAAAAASSGGRLTLDLRETPSYSIFSGQIVAVKGLALREGVMGVTDVAYRAPPLPVQTRRDNAEVMAGLRASSGPMRVFVASGPYTAPCDLKYEFLQTLLSEVVAQKPDVLILCGPFVDAEHDSIKSGMADGDGTPFTFRGVFTDICESAPTSVRPSTVRPTTPPIGPLPHSPTLPLTAVLNLVEMYLGNDEAARDVQLVLIPSVNDVNSEPVFPQWPITADDLVKLGQPDEEGAVALYPLRPRTTVLSNPCSFVCGDLLWGACTADPVFALNSDDATSLIGPDKALDRYTLLSNHILDQRSYYPLFPAGLPAANPRLKDSAADADQAARGTPLEVLRMWNLGLPACPDILILPSRLGFAQVRPLGQHTVVINPGSLSRQKTYAKVLVFPDMEVGGESGDMVTHRAQARVRVDVEKITV
jgi:DNA polymerase alpha subunit B